MADVRAFLEGQLHLPPSMHDQFAIFRKALGTRFKQFGDLKTFRDQLAYFFEVFSEAKVIPANWVVFATSTAFLYKAAGKFVEETGKLFQSEEQLGHFCSMRAKYILMGLKDLVQMKQMKCSDDFFRPTLGGSRQVVYQAGKTIVFANSPNCCSSNISHHDSVHTKEN